MEVDWGEMAGFPGSGHLTGPGRGSVEGQAGYPACTTGAGSRASGLNFDTNISTSDTSIHAAGAYGGDAAAATRHAGRDAAIGDAAADYDAATGRTARANTDARRRNAGAGRR